MPSCFCPVIITFSSLRRKWSWLAFLLEDFLGTSSRTGFSSGGCVSSALVVLFCSSSEKKSLSMRRRRRRTSLLERAGSDVNSSSLSPVGEGGHHVGLFLVLTSSSSCLLRSVGFGCCPCRSCTASLRSTTKPCRERRRKRTRRRRAGSVTTAVAGGEGKRRSSLLLT